MSATVGSVVTYPVKGCAGIELNSSPVGFAGLEHDRTFMIVDADGSFRSQRTDPILAAIVPSVDDAVLTLAHPNTGRVRVDIDLSSPARDVTMFRAPFRGIDQGDHVAAWLTDVIGEQSRLVAVPPDNDRVTDGQRPGTAGFADSAAVHVLSDVTSSDLDSRLPTPLPIDRFRPNIVVTGWDIPHTEDLLRQFSIGSAAFAYTKLAIRCAVTTVDQATGERSGPEPLRTLASYRRARQKGVAFGAKFAVTGEGVIAVGDTIEVTGWGESEL